MARLSVITVFSMVTFCRCLCSNSIKCPRLQHNGCNSQRSDTSRPETINFGLMLSFRDRGKNDIFSSAFDDGHDIAPAAYLAVEEVNNRSDLLHDYRISISRFDSGCNVRVRTLLSVNELYCSCEPIVGIIGPSCEESSVIVSHFTNRAEFSKVTINYGVQTYSNYSFKIFGSGTRIVEAIADLIENNKWNNSALLYDGGPNAYIKHVMEGIIEHTKLSGYGFRTILPVYDNYYIPVNELKNLHIRITVILASSSTLLRLLCLAYHEGMMFPNYQWIFESKIDLDFHETSFTYNESWYNCTDSDISSSLKGSINFFLSALSDEGQSNTTSDAGVTYGEYNRAYRMQANKYSSKFGVPSQPVLWAKGFYDAVWILAIALNDSLADLNTSLTEFRWGSQSLAERIRNHLLNVDYRGIIGGIRFDNGTGANKKYNMTVVVSQYGQNLTSKRIALYDGNFTFISTSPDMFIKANFETRYMHINRHVAVILLVVTILSLAITIFAHVVNIIYRNHKAIKSSSPALNNLIFLGCYLTVIGIIIDIVSHDKAVVEKGSKIRVTLCTLFAPLVSIGTTLLFGTICAKTWRLHRIYTLGRELKTDVRFIQGSYLFGFVCILAMVDLFTCLLWHFISPFMLSRRDKLTFDSDTENEDPVLLVKETCRSSYAVYFFSVLLLQKALVIIASFYMAITTNINIREFKTSNIIILTYLITVLFVLGIPLYLLVSGSDDIIFVKDIIYSVFLNITVFVCVVLLFLPLIEYVACSGLCVTLRVHTCTRSNEL